MAFAHSRGLPCAHRTALLHTHATACNASTTVAHGHTGIPFSSMKQDVPSDLLKNITGAGNCTQKHTFVSFFPPFCFVT